jgi:large subunit ribosomal protein LP0
MPAKARALKTKEVVAKKKEDYLEKVQTLLEEYPRFLVVTCDNIGSTLMQNIRLALRKIGAVLLMGKNTLIRKAIRDKLEEHPHWEPIMFAVKMNCGLVFTKGSLTDIRDTLQQLTVPAVAKSGSIAPDDVLLPKQVTTLEPTKTSFFAALDIATKITKGCVEILNPVKLCERGKKVGSSEAALLAMLDIKPFVYGLIIVNCYDGSLFQPSYLDFTETQLFASIANGISQMAALSLAISYPTLPAFPHLIANGFKNAVAVALETGYSFKQAEAIKQRVENPDAFVVSTPVTSDKSAQPKAEEKKAEKEPSAESEEQEDAGGLMDFF